MLLVGILPCHSCSLDDVALSRFTRALFSLGHFSAKQVHLESQVPRVQNFQGQMITIIDQFVAECKLRRANIIS